MAPVPLEYTMLVYAATGTALTSFCANSINQVLEVPYDSQMARTRNRVLVRGKLSPLHAASFGVVSGGVGLGILATMTNPLTACLGAANVLLYTAIYTPMKRHSIVNTWIGSAVGAIPPLMGWAAATGRIDLGALLLAGVLYSWQFPHFNSLSWNLRADYSRAGYRMMSVTNPGLCQRTALYHSLYLCALCSAMPLAGVTSWTFAIDSFLLNGYLVYLAWRFNCDGDSQSSRKLFRFSLVHLPGLLILMLVSKKRGGEESSKESFTKTTERYDQQTDQRPDCDIHAVA